MDKFIPRKGDSNLDVLSPCSCRFKDLPLEGAKGFRHFVVVALGSFMFGDMKKFRAPRELLVEIGRFQAKVCFMVLG